MTYVGAESKREFTEPSARKFVIDRLGNGFDFMEEVWATDKATGDRYRLDAVSVCEATGHVLGWEFKRSHLFKKEFADALRQASNYRMAHIDDQRFPGISGKLVEACIVFPDWDGLHASGRMDYAREADGMRLLASHWRVGVMRKLPLEEHTSIIVGEQAIWHSKSGWTKNADGVLLRKRRRGATRKFDI